MIFIEFTQDNNKPIVIHIKQITHISNNQFNGNSTEVYTVINLINGSRIFVKESYKEVCRILKNIRGNQVKKHRGNHA